jgi:hypothetical protein
MTYSLSEKLDGYGSLPIFWQRLVSESVGMVGVINGVIVDMITITGMTPVVAHA